MTVRAAHFALLYFLEDSLPGKAATYHFTDIAGLDACDVIELKNV
jgi:hypothetical protein